MFNSNKIKRLEGERDDYAKRWIEANDRAQGFKTLLDNCNRDGDRLARKYATLNHRFAATEAMLRSAREANSRYFYELSKMKRRPELVVCYMGEHEDYFHRRWRVWTIWLDGVRIGREQCIADNVDQPEQLWRVVEALEGALGVKRMRATFRVKPMYEQPFMRGKIPEPWARR